MITVQLLGGMGNQLFQFALALALRARGYQVRLDKTRLAEGNPHPCIREYSLDVFNAGPFGVPEGDQIREKSLRYDPKFLSPPDPAVMSGYWQSEKYFKDHEDYVRAARGMAIERALPPAGRKVASVDVLAVAAFRASRRALTARIRS
jgi:hypothetical protein